MKTPSGNTKGVAPQKHSTKPPTHSKGDASKLVKHDESKVEGEVYPASEDKDVSPATRAKDLDHAAGAEGMNLDFPNTALQDRYQPISPFRMRALGGSRGK